MRDRSHRHPLGRSPPAPRAPAEGAIDAIAKLGEEATKAGVFVEAGGLLPTASGARLKLSGGKVAVTDGRRVSLDTCAQEELIELARSAGPQSQRALEGLLLLPGRQVHIRGQAVRVQSRDHGLTGSD